MLLAEILLSLGLIIFFNGDKNFEKRTNKNFYPSNNNNTNSLISFNLSIERYSKDGVKKSATSVNKRVQGTNNLLKEKILKNLNISRNNHLQINFKQIVIRNQHQNAEKPHIIKQTVHEGTENITINSPIRTIPKNNLKQGYLNHSQNQIATTINPVPSLFSNKNDQYCEYSKTVINNNQKICKGKLIFEDDFTEINWTKWKRDIRIPLDSEDAEFVSFQNLKQNLYVKEGNLYILPTLLTELPGYDNNVIRSGTLKLGLNCTGVIDPESECTRQGFAFRILPPIVSARITTKNKFSFKYGIIEVKAKLPKGDWLFPQLFLEPLNNHYGNNGYQSGQIRLAFIRSNEILKTSNNFSINGSKLYGGVVLSQEEKHREIWMANCPNKNAHYGDNYHVYKTLWTDELITFYVDEKEYGTLYGNFSDEAFYLHNIKYANVWKTGNKIAPFDKEFFISFGVSAGGISDFPDYCVNGPNYGIDKKPWLNFDSKNELNFWKATYKWHSTWKGEDAALKIDYIRVYAL